MNWRVCDDPNSVYGGSNKYIVSDVDETTRYNFSSRTKAKIFAKFLNK